MNYIFQIISLFLALVLFSCTSDEECHKEKVVQLKMLFYNRTLNETTRLFTYSALTVDSVTVKAIDTDSILYNNSKSVSQVYLPLRNTEAISKYVFQFNQETDTVTVLHTNNNYYVSLECGCIKTFTIDTVLTTSHFIDSVQIVNHDVTTLNAEHVQIFK